MVAEASPAFTRHNCPGPWLLSPSRHDPTTDPHAATCFPRQVALFFSGRFLLCAGSQAISNRMPGVS